MNHDEGRARSVHEHATAELERQFTYHPPTEGEKYLYQQINNACLNAAKVILSACPPGADRAAAIRKIREARMTANAAIACAPKHEEGS